ncbi:hypothetical protein ACQPYV_09205 [Micromonospora saelicesensis]|uniref:hypothetical protein n=1 Tax=Micromonospora saelicesensis TaxID=285676 RepID=UPI003D8C0C4A
MAAKKRSLIGGVDTHRDTHHAAVIDSTGGLLDEHRHWLEIRTHFRQFLADEQYSNEVQQPCPANSTRSDPSTPYDLG